MKESLSIIGIGAFGEFMLKHLTPYYKTRIFDNQRDLSGIANSYNVHSCSLKEAAEADIVVIATPVKYIESVCEAITPHLRPDQLIMDVASVKILPQQIMVRHMPTNVDIIGLHPLFGPQSGKRGINGLNIALVNIQGDKSPTVKAFLKERLGLNVIECTAEEHDRQMAYVQGITHMIAKVFQGMDVPKINQGTNTFDLLQQMVDLVKNDSPELFRTIQADNPFSMEVRKRFFDQIRKLEQLLDSR